MTRMFAPLSNASSIGLEAPASKALVCCGKLENRYPRSKVPTRGTRLAEIDDPDDYAEFHGIDDIDFLTELIVGKEGDLDLLVEPVRFQAFDEVVVIDAAVGKSGVVGKGGGQLKFQRGGLGKPDEGRRGSQPRGRSRRRLQDDASVDEVGLHGAPPRN